MDIMKTVTEKFLSKPVTLFNAFPEIPTQLFQKMIVGQNYISLLVKISSKILLTLAFLEKVLLSFTLELTLKPFSPSYPSMNSSAILIALNCL